MWSFVEFLLLASAVGGIDVCYFHLYRFRLSERPGSRAETWAHLGQAATFIAICLGAALAPRRSEMILSLFALHFVSIAADAWLERASRAELGGLPSTEYLLHIAGAVSTGAAFAAYLLGAPSRPTALERAGLLIACLAGAAVSATELFLLWKVNVGRSPAGRHPRNLTSGVET
jgi:hypothetical protein